MNRRQWSATLCCLYLVGLSPAVFAWGVPAGMGLVHEANWRLTPVARQASGGTEQQAFDPLPAENPPEPLQAAERPPSSSDRTEITMISDEQAFRSLSPPVNPPLASSDPRGDWLRLGAPVPNRPGERELAFPPEVTLPPVPTTTPPPLDVLRHYPTGKEVVSDVITVSFNQPVGALTTLTQQTQGARLLEVTPEVGGGFEWLGSSTLAYRVSPRLPIATEFVVKVPAGVATPSGAVLANEHLFQFATPLPAVSTIYPYEGEIVDTLPTLELSFNGRMDPQSVLEHTILEGPGKSRIPLKLVVDEAASAQLRLLRQTDPVAAKELELKIGSTVRLVPARPLRLASRYVATVAPGFRSLEGPLAADKGRSVSFVTYSPLRILDVGCGWEPRQKEVCESWSTVNIMFNNDIETMSLKELVKIVPPVEELAFDVSGTFIGITGRFKPDSLYTITVKPGVKDIYGQTERKGASATVRIAPPVPDMVLGARGHAVLEAEFDPKLELQTIGMKQASAYFYAVPPQDLPEAMAALSRGDYTEHGAGKDMGLVLAKKVPLKFPGKNSDWTATQLDLRPALGGHPFGVVLVEVSARVQAYGEWERRSEMSLVQVTNLGLTVLADTRQVYVAVAELSSGALRPGIEVTVTHLKSGQELGRSTTDPSGMVSMPLGGLDIADSPTLLVTARSGEDLAFLAISLGGTLRSTSSYDYVGTKRVPKVASLVFPERGVYRPGEIAHLTALVRSPRPGPFGDMAPVAEAHSKCTWIIEDPRRTKVATGNLDLGAFGVANLDFSIPKDAPLGNYQLRFECGDASFQGGFNVQEFRSPEFKTQVSWLAGNENILMHRKLGVRVVGEYLFGAPMAGAHVEWRLSRHPGGYQPPGNPGFTFRDFQPNAASGPGGSNWNGRRDWNQVIKYGEGELDPGGTLDLELELDPGESSNQAATFSLEAEIIDANYQSISGRASVVAHWAERYVGLRLSKYVTLPGESVQADAIVTRLDGQRLVASADVRLFKTQWVQEEEQTATGVDHRWVFTETEVERCEASVSEKPGNCTFAPVEPGDYVVRATTFDLKGRPSRSAESLWVSGQLSPGSQYRAGTIELVSDKKEYAPGETARILVRSPYREANGLVYVSREGIASVMPFTAAEGTATVDVPIEAHFVPSLTVDVVLFKGRSHKPGAAGDPDRPSQSTKRIVLAVTPEQRRINLELVATPGTVAPGETVTLTLKARDSVGNGVAANVVLALVDEGVLSLTQYETPNPLRALYLPRNAGTTASDTRQWVVPRGPQEVPRTQGGLGGSGGASLNGSGGAMMKVARPSIGAKNGAGKRAKQYDFSDETIEGELHAPSFYVRSFLATTAYFNAALQTDPDGNLSLQVKMPDNLTRFRLMALAADRATLLGSDESQITTRLPFMVRPSMPRFINVGDTFEASAVVTNVSDVNTVVKVRAFADNLNIGQDVLTVELPAGQSKSVTFHASAKVPGPVTVRFAVVSMTRRPYTDAADVTIPTLLPATTEATATYGSTEDTVLIPLIPPKDVLPQYGGLELSLSSTALTGLQDALSYLVLYPYDCTEQLASRAIGIVSLRDILADFNIGGLDSASKADELTLEAVARLSKYVRDDGGMGFWPSSRFSWLHASAYALYALDLLSKSGVGVTPALIRGLQNFLLRRLDDLVKPGVETSPIEELRWEARALDSQALAVLALVRSGSVLKAASHLERLLSKALEPFDQGLNRLDLPLYAGGWLAQALHLYDPNDPRLQKFLTAFNSAAVETTGSLVFAEGSYESQKLMWFTPERTTAIVLLTLLQLSPHHPLVEKTVRGLGKARVKGRWSNTQANAFALQALNLYYRTYENLPPNFVARVWLGPQGVLAAPFQGRTLDVVKALVPMQRLLEEEAAHATLGKEGPGRLYYRMGLRYAPSNLSLPALDRGFLVERSYLKEGDEQPLERDAEGAWHVKQGEYVRVRLRITAPTHRYFVAVTDPMPAGLESVNEAFATSARTRQGNQFPSRERWGGRWFTFWSPWDHQEKRDDRVALFQDRMYGGVYEYTYLAKATTVGVFVVPPTRAEEMYEPETFGRTQSEILVVDLPK